METTSTFTVLSVRTPLDLFVEVDMVDMVDTEGAGDYL